MSKPTRADKIRPEKVEYLWGNIIPRGMISVIAGRPDQGKGLLAALIAAEISNNAENSNLGREGKILYSAAEDSHELMTRPRLEAASAKLENIALWRFALPEHMAEFDALVRNDGNPVDLVIMDPFASHIPTINRHGDGARVILEQIRDVIEDTGTALLIIEHALKRVPASGHVLQGIGGTALPQFARAAFVYGKNPDDEDERVLCPAKFNIGRWPKPLSFDLDVEDIDKVGETPYLMLSDELEAFDPMRLFVSKKQPGAGGPTRGRPADKREAAAEWLTNYLAEADEPVLSGKIQEDAKQYNMSVKTLRRAAEDMKVVKDPPGGGRNCTWDLPDDVKILMGLMDEDGNPAHVEEDPPEDDLTEELGPKLDESGKPLTEDEINLDGMDDELANLLGGGGDVDVTEGEVDLKGKKDDES